MDRKRIGLRFGTAVVAAVACIAIHPGRGEASGRPLAADFTASAGSVHVVAHRGGAELAPENTVAAYRAAVARHDAAAECDVQVSADGELVVIHDSSLRRTTDGVGNVARSSWKKLRKLDAGRWKGADFRGEHLPKLGEVLDVTRDELVLFVELKRGRDIVKKVAAELEKRPGQRSQIILISFEPKLLAEAAKRMPDIPRMYLRRSVGRIPFGDRALEQAAQAHATMIGLEEGGVRSKIIRRAHERGLPVYSFTVNDHERAYALSRMGIDGIITDAPDRIRASLTPQRRALAARD